MSHVKPAICDNVLEAGSEGTMNFLSACSDRDLHSVLCRHRQVLLLNSGLKTTYITIRILNPSSDTFFSGTVKLSLLSWHKQYGWHIKAWGLGCLYYSWKVHQWWLNFKQDVNPGMERGFVNKYCEMLTIRTQYIFKHPMLCTGQLGHVCVEMLARQIHYIIVCTCS